MASWHRVASADQVTEGGVLAVEVEGVPLGIYVLGNEYFALGDVCPHQGDVYLSDGYLEGETIECPLHQSCFSIRTGEHLSAPAEDDVVAYPVRVDGGELYVEC